MENLFKVASKSHPTSTAGAIAGSIRDGKSVVLQAIGAGSVNQAVKAIAIARGYLAGDGLDVICVPEFIDLDLDGNERTAVRLHVDQPGRPFPPAKAWAPKDVPASGSNGA
jgi:stage V sporulation protein S